MSGGSFNYLCHKEVWELAHGVGEEWDSMLQELDELCPEAATEMRAIRKSTQEFVDEHEKRWNRLNPLLHDIEWWRSNDYGFDQVELAIEKYRSSNESN